MTEAIMLDSGPLGRIAHPRPNREIAEWLERLLDSGVTVILPEIADYEVRRNLLLERLTKSVARLDRLKEVLIYQPLTTEVILRAAEMWADARRSGIPTAGARGTGRRCHSCCSSRTSWCNCRDRKRRASFSVRRRPSVA